MYKKVLTDLVNVATNMPPWHSPHLLQQPQELPDVTCYQALALRALDADAWIASHCRMDMSRWCFQECNLRMDWQVGSDG